MMPWHTLEQIFFLPNSQINKFDVARLVGKTPEQTLAKEIKLPVLRLAQKVDVVVLVAHLHPFGHRF